MTYASNASGGLLLSHLDVDFLVQRKMRLADVAMGVEISYHAPVSYFNNTRTTRDDGWQSHGHHGSWSVQVGAG
jgi:hypothetical protein